MLVNVEWEYLGVVDLRLKNEDHKLTIKKSFELQTVSDLLM